MNLYQQLHCGYYAGHDEEGREKQPNSARIAPSSTLPFEHVVTCNNVLGHLKQNVVMVDFDDMDDANAFEKILAKLGLRVPTLTTTKGKHFYFEANKYCPTAITHRILACGLKADFKLGNKNGLDLIKFKGQWRELKNADSVLIPLPDFCKPLNDAAANNGISFSHLREGARNDTLFKFNGRLIRAGFTKNRAQEIIRDIINGCVMPEPLPYEQCLQVTRDEIYDKTQSYDDGKTFRFDAMGRDLIRELSIIKVNNSLYTFDNGVYNHLSLEDCETIISQTIPTLNSAKRTEVVKWIKLNAPKKRFDINSDPNLHLIAFNNGWLNVKTGTMQEPDESILIFNRIPHNYVQYAYSPIADRFIKAIACNDREIERSIYEMIGHCFYRRNVIRGCFLLVGEKRNGKSTLFKTLSYVLGDNNVSKLKMHQIEERFLTCELENKLANIGDDISDAYIKDANNLKSAASSDSIVVERKGLDSYIINPYATLIFSANNLPRISDVTGAMLDRMTIIPCRATFTPDNPDFDQGIVGKLLTEEVAEHLIYNGIMAFNEALSRGYLSSGSVTHEIVADYALTNNPILSFITSDSPALCCNLESLEGAPVSTIYSMYVQFCQIENIKPVARNVFSRRMCSSLLNLCTMRIFDGTKQVTTFVKIDPTAPFLIKNIK